MRELTKYKNFWLIWLNSAGMSKGISLFKIQSEWGIKTNYLYHDERGLGKPLYLAMIKAGYLEKEGRRLKARFQWIPAHMKSRFELPHALGVWSPNKLINYKWYAVQEFLEKNSQLLFDHKNLHTLYRDSRDSMGMYGQQIFNDIFLLVLYSNLITFCKKYKADIVSRILITTISMFPERNLLGYIRNLLTKVKEIPLIISDENELNALMCPMSL